MGTVPTPYVWSAGEQATRAKLQVASDALTFLLNPPMARVTQSGAQSLTNNTVTNIAFTVESYDTDSMHDNVTNNSRLTVQTAGTYHVIGMGTFAASATGERLVMVVKNGTAFGYQRIPSAAAATAMELSVAGDIAASVGDYFELQMRQVSGGALNTGTNLCALSARWVST